MTLMGTHTRTSHQRHRAARLVEPVPRSPAPACLVQFCLPRAVVSTPWTGSAETLCSYSALAKGRETKRCVSALAWRSSWKRPPPRLPDLLYLLQRSSEAVLSSHQVSFFPVLLPQRVPALNQARLQLDSTGKALFCFGTEVRGHVQTSALLQQVLSSVFKLIYWRGTTPVNWCPLFLILCNKKRVFAAKQNRPSFSSSIFKVFSISFATSLSFFSASSTLWVSK